MDVDDNESSDFDDVLSGDEASDCESNFSWADSSVNDIHFGNEPSDLSDRPLFNYGFSALEDGSFRLLKLLGGDSEPIRCQLVDVQFNQGEKYEALSYRWTSQNWAMILVDDQRISVTANVRNALQNMRHKTSYRLVWIDAICINQNDEEEKTHQVRQMAKIYQNAQRTVIWLGLRTPETDRLFQYLHEAIRNTNLYKHQDRDELREAWQRRWSTTERTKQISGLRQLLENEWFRRVWIIQEVAQSRSAIIMCGDFLVPTNIFALLPYLLGIEPDQHCQEILAIMPGVREELSSSDPYDKGSGSWAYPDLLTLLLLFKDSESTEPKDKIYALLGLSVQHKHDRFVLDYGKSEEQIVCDTVTSIIPAYPAEGVPKWNLDEFLGSLDSLSQVLLIWAAREGHNSVLELLLETETIEADWVSPKGDTALYIAAQSSQLEAVRLLLQTEKVDVNRLHTYTRKTPLSIATAESCEEGDIIVEMLFETEKVNLDMYRVSDRLMEWVMRPDMHKELQEHRVKIMIRAGLVNFKDSEGSSMLSLSLQSNHANIIKLLLKTEGIDVDPKSQDCQTLLNIASRWGYTKAIELLLGIEGIEVNTKDHNSRTPLSIASQWGNTGAMKLLLGTKGIEVNSKDRNGRAPLSFAAHQGKKGAVRLLLGKEGIKVNSKDQDGRTPLSFASQWGDTDIVKLLLGKKGIEVDAKDNTLRTPLSWAAEGRFGRVDTVHLLLKSGKVDVNSTDQWERTPLSWAAQGGDIKIVKLLLKKGRAKVDSKDLDGRSPLLIAQEYDHQDVVEILRDWHVSGTHWRWQFISFPAWSSITPFRWHGR